LNKELDDNKDKS